MADSGIKKKKRKPIRSLSLCFSLLSFSLSHRKLCLFLVAHVWQQSWMENILLHQSRPILLSNTLDSEVV